ncbi:glutamyl-tRNA amidotransferase subunit C [Pelistega indica]|uniref:Aspartyl/glutamyl-tRNA(Asn/Gln) amidotransferase subunit C n=1 Tax=Pelistega indica TaxID=1414851 RepID=V8FXM8_9BURK|nr:MULTISPECIES: Asp-tRNA(Asn)/Glu-tRNA(Gln) amidotransferase subunit GatC [Pelistega]ETD68930.1 glutamyl-tRNA amidotransferase subunit C [Pelistega indica]
MSLTLNDVNRIARLSRLELDEQEQAQALLELNSMLGLIAQLQSVDTSGVTPLAHPLSVHEEISLRLREDIVTETSSLEKRAELMANAPAESNGLFLVPKVIE